MKEHLSVVTRKGQVTIPADIRKALHLHQGDSVTLRLEDGEVKLSPAHYTLESAYGAVQPKQRPEDLEEISNRAKEQKTRETVEEFSGR